jgi:sugar phosphate isomerase/epimerase
VFTIILAPRRLDKANLHFGAAEAGNILFPGCDFGQVRRGMDAIGYRGWILVEQWNEVPGKKPLGFDETHRRNLQYLREVFPQRA